MWLEGRKGLRGCGTLRYRGHNETPSDTEPCGTKLMMVHSDTPKNFGTTNFGTTNVRTTRSEAINLRSDKPRKRQMCWKPLTSEKSKKNLRRDTKLTYLVYYLFQQDQDSEATNDKTYSNKAEIQE